MGTLTNANVYAYNKPEQILFIEIAKSKKFSILKDSPFPFTQSIKVHRRALAYLPALFPAIVAKNPQENLTTLIILIMQRDNIHA